MSTYCSLTCSGCRAAGVLPPARDLSPCCSAGGPAKTNKQNTTTRHADKGYSPCGRKGTLTFHLPTPYSKQENRDGPNRHIKEIYCMPEQENPYQIPKCCHGPRAQPLSRHHGDSARSSRSQGTNKLVSKLYTACIKETWQRAKEYKDG